MIDEPGSSEAGAVWDAADRRISSRLLYLEARAALARAARAGRVDIHPSKDVLEELWQDVDSVEVSSGVARQAGELAELHSLRGYDAVHLASLLEVADADTILVAADGDLRVSAGELGIVVARLP